MTFITGGAAVTDRLNRPLHDLRISVTDRCNFRCGYCMPADTYDDNYQFLNLDDYLTFEEIDRLSRLFVSAGVRKIRLTGGEPLLRKDLYRLVASLSKIEGLRDLAMITNGYLLGEHAAMLKKSGLDRVTISLDSLDNDVFAAMNGRGIQTGKVLEGIDRAAGAGLTPVKINCVILRYINDESVMPLVEYSRRTGHAVRFIEYMDVGNCNGWRYHEVVPSHEIRNHIETRYSLVPLEKNYRGDVADRFGFADGIGELGFISSVTEPFCGSCSRVRLSADGKLYTCLFAQKGTDLKTPLRNGADDDELYQLICSVWNGRDDRYSELRGENGDSINEGRNRVEMYEIGG